MIKVYPHKNSKLVIAELQSTKLLNLLDLPLPLQSVTARILDGIGHRMDATATRPPEDAIAKRAMRVGVVIHAWTTMS